MDTSNKGYLIISEAAEQEYKPTIISEQKEFVAIETFLQDADRANRNKRLYGSKTLNEALKAPYVIERVKTKTWYGEAGHPISSDMQRQLSIDHTRISHIVTRAWMEGTVIKGIVESAMTAVGKDFGGLIRQGSKVAFSMRGIGPITEQKKDYLEIKSPLNILAYDWVIHPSHDNAYMQKTLNEGSSLYDAFDKKIMTEGLIIPVMESAVMDFIKSSSQNLRDISDQFEIPTFGAKLSEDCRFVTITDGQNVTANVRVEEHIQKELRGFLLGGR
jgi:hypothetical protein